MIDITCWVSSLLQSIYAVFFLPQQQARSVNGLLQKWRIRVCCQQLSLVSFLRLKNLIVRKQTDYNCTNLCRWLQPGNNLQDHPIYDKFAMLLPAIRRKNTTYIVKWETVRSVKVCSNVTSSMCPSESPFKFKLGSVATRGVVYHCNLKWAMNGMDGVCNPFCPSKRPLHWHNVKSTPLLTTTKNSSMIFVTRCSF